MTKKSIVLYLAVHQPLRVRQYTVFDIASRHDYFDEAYRDTNHNNQRVFERVADKSYRPMTILLKRLLEEHQDFCFTISLSGVFLEQAEKWTPDVIATFQDIIKTGRVEVLSETYHHSLAFFYSPNEFERQVRLHRTKIEDLFGVTPKVFRNTELAYNDNLASWAERRGYKGVVAEGWDDVLGWRSPNYLYQAAGSNDLSLLLRNHRLSDDLTLRFNNQGWSEWPLTSHKYSQWLSKDYSSPIVNLFMDFETFGERQDSHTGIFNFFGNFIETWLKTVGHTFSTASNAIDQNEAVDTISMPEAVTWSGNDRDLSTWNGNELQCEALRYIYNLENEILSTENPMLIDDWRYMLASDHTYYMSTKWDADGGVHGQFNPYDSPYDAFLSYINVIRDLRWRVMQYRKGL